jgi:mRNA interferase HigB
VRVISKKRLKGFYEKHPSSKSALESWYKVASRTKWGSLIEVQKTYRDAESVENFTVFNIKGNSIRLIVLIDYKNAVVFVRHVLTHAEYDKEGWKKDVWFE